MWVAGKEMKLYLRDLPMFCGNRSYFVKLSTIICDHHYEKTNETNLKSETKKTFIYKATEANIKRTQ